MPRAVIGIAIDAGAEVLSPATLRPSVDFGGTCARVLTPDADLDPAADAMVKARFGSAGKCCRAASSLDT